jgi:hypothetical protein
VKQLYAQHVLAASAAYSAYSCSWHEDRAGKQLCCIWLSYSYASWLRAVLLLVVVLLLVLLLLLLLLVVVVLLLVLLLLLLLLVVVVLLLSLLLRTSLYRSATA